MKIWLKNRRLNFWRRALLHVHRNVKKLVKLSEGYTFIKRFPRQEEVFRVHLLEDSSIKLLYQRRLAQNLTHSPCSHNINAEWQILKNTLQQAANEALGKRMKRRHRRRLILWNEDRKKPDWKQEEGLFTVFYNTFWHWQNRIQKVSGNGEKRNKEN